MLDWTAVFLTTYRNVAPAQAGFGYAAFAAAMTLGRLNGDRFVQSFGGIRVLRLGCLAAILGLTLVVLVPTQYAAFAGFMLAGAGCANLVPVLYTAAGISPPCRPVRQFRPSRQLATPACCVARR